MPGRCVVVMAKRPREGAVKTRLGADLGEEAACRLYEAFLFDTLDACAAADATTMVAFTPVTEAAWFRHFAPGLLLSAQPEGSFGERLRAAMQAAFGAGFSTVAVIGSDVPHLRSATIDAGLDIAARGTAALAPTADGGYCLLALGAPRPELFEDIDWSSGRELAQTIQRIRDSELDFEMLTETFDVDTFSDLRRLARAIAEGEATCRRTAEALRLLDLELLELEPVP